MRISIWQQFSSNHSASFTIAGKFESTERAEAVAHELRHILQTISNYWQQYGNKERTTIENRLIETEQLTPPEIAFRDQYQVGWTEYFGSGKTFPLDWVHGDWALEGVRVFRNIVYLEPPGNTYAGPKPFDAIMEKLGGQLAVWEEVGDGALVVSIKFSTPNQEIADAVDRRITRYEDSSIWFLKLPIFGNKTAGQFHRDGLAMEFHDVYLSWAGLDFDYFVNFQKLVAFIEDNNCIVVDYEFNIIPYQDK
ncbi:MAG: hypothetical protein ABI690_20490 [Chloroflexota bacterium]